MNAPAAAPQEAADLSIRTKPPSPKRLSRKVLLAGAAVLASIIAAAFVFGLSEPERRPGREAQSAAATAGAPESIQGASSQYDALDLGMGDEIAANEDTLAPPQDPMWAERPQIDTTTPSAPAQAQADPEQVARASPILFAGNARESRSADDRQRLSTRLTPPRSRYEILAGSTIAAALMTELNSDLPGQVIAQVTSPVFDSVSGDHLLIPQGARLIGTYENAARYGDRRILLNWNRLILPNGWSIDLESMQGADASGAAGVSDRVDQHLDRLAATIGLAAIVSVVANNAEGDDEDDRLGESVADAAAQEAARTGGRIIEREMSVRPTLRIRAGAPVRVLVTRDIQLRPYQARGQ